ncbi:hypothetical protein [Pseudobacteroides cellulosolvens]|uniref:Clostridium neurotoxin receptor binding N-terminal domain-containing protein n=1 Tax=Pseudobacteroides cellulosolvens ATCC 35603 = DSM 2933 TaxID=398512 RepID=A0A0L6JTI0_9FIRM|nr:hypothetical protein [Pseudobacteroides cellulosolvens]KNY28702.1 hypothetical protein Bccel_3976 [Pseudobacteroides cellulosolvens ATCC 35603 = DSM 2933]
MKVKRKVVKKIMAFTLAGLLSIQSMPLLTNATTTGSFSTPVLSCSFDNGAAADTSGYSNGGTFKGTTLPTVTTGMNKSGLAFNNSGYVEVPNSASLNFGTGDFSVSFWIKTSVSDQVIFDNKALTDTEVTTLFNQANTVSPTNTPSNTPVSTPTNTPTKTPTPTNTPTKIPTPTNTPTPTPLSSAVAIWKFDNSLSDSSGNGNNLTTSSTAEEVC